MGDSNFLSSPAGIGSGRMFPGYMQAVHLQNLWTSSCQTR